MYWQITLIKFVFDILLHCKIISAQFCEILRQAGRATTISIYYSVAQVH